VKIVEICSLTVFGCHETRIVEKKQCSQFSEQFLSPSSPMVMGLGQWPKEYDRKCKHPKWDICKELKELC